MNKPIIVLLLTLTLVSCQKKSNLVIKESEFRGKTFNIHFKSEIDTMIIDFQDSTHQIFGDLWAGKLPWRISHYDNTNILVLDNRLIGIKKKSENSFDCTYIGLTDQSFTMSERKSKWNKELIYGIWLKKEDEKEFDNSKNDSIQRPPLPPAPEGFSEKDFKWPPYYIITNDSIKFYSSYSVNESSIDINNTTEFISMKLNHSPLIGIEWIWKIKNLNDSLMVLEKEITENGSILYKYQTLIKKR